MLVHWIIFLAVRILNLCMCPRRSFAALLRMQLKAVDCVTPGTLVDAGVPHISVQCMAASGVLRSEVGGQQRKLPAFTSPKQRLRDSN